MATDSFKFWDSYTRALDKVDYETAGRIIQALGHEVFYGEQPDFSDEPILSALYEVLLGQATQSRDLARQARAAAKRPRPSRRKKKASDTLAHASTPASAPSSEKRREEVKGIETSSLREEGAAYAGSGSRPPATPAPDPWDDPDYDGPIPYLGPDDSDGTDWA